jgi:regulatory protein
MAQTWHSRRQGPRPARRPLDERTLEERAITYVGRYATTRARLAAYLERKLAERGWTGDAPPPIDALVDRLATLGYVDDESFAAARASALKRRGYGARRVEDALRAAGIEPAIRAAAKADDADESLRTALALARRRRLGPFAVGAFDRDDHRRAMGVMLRAGHDLEVARRVLSMAPEEAEALM